MTTVATALPAKFVSARASLMNRSMPTISPTPAAHLTQGDEPRVAGRRRPGAAPNDDALSASEVAALVGALRVTARRYLEHLADLALAVQRSRYGAAGRPEVEYHWLG